MGLGIIEIVDYSAKFEPLYKFSFICWPENLHRVQVAKVDIATSIHNNKCGEVLMKQFDKNAE